MDTYSNRFQNLAKFAALIVTGVFLGVLAFVIMQTATGPNVFPNLAAFFSFTRERVVISVSPEVSASGNPVVVGWNHEGKSGDGEYVFSYECRRGVVLTFTADHVAIPCGQYFPLSARPSADITINSDSATQERFVVAIGFVSSGKTTPELEGTATVAVDPAFVVATNDNETDSNGSGMVTSAPEAPSSLTPGSQKTEVVIRGSTLATGISVPGGRPDLKIELVALGYIDAITNQFIATSSVYRSWQSAIIFDVTNFGNAESGQWKLTAHLPVFDGFFIPKELEPTIKPGEKIRYTIGFQHLNSFGLNTAIVTLDPDNSLNDSNRSNDSLSVTIFAFDASQP
jgi:hypothetical protein